MKQNHVHDAIEYGPIRAAWVGLFQPVKAVRRADHLGLGWAWSVHVAGVVMLGLLAGVLAAWDLNGGKVNPSRLLDRLVEIAVIVWGISDDPRLWAGLTAVALVTELTWALSAGVVMSWCAREEPYLASYRRASRRLLLLTPHLVSIMAIVGVAFVWMHNSPRWRLGFFSGLNAQGFLVWLIIVAPVCLWALWVVVKALGVHHAPAVSRWPLHCEGCGYVLTGLDTGGDCPECGLAIVKTLSRENRPGIAPAGGVRWWVSQTYQAIRTPTAFGKRMHVMSAELGHRRCLGLTIVMQVLLTPVALVGLVYFYREIDQPPVQRFRHIMPMATSACIVIGLTITATTAGVALLIAGLAGVTEGRHLNRNLMPAAVRAAGYLSGFAVIWSVVFWCSLALPLVAWEYSLLPAISAKYNVAGEQIIIYWHYGVTLIGILIYGALIERVTRAARYANW